MRKSLNLLIFITGFILAAEWSNHWAENLQMDGANFAHYLKHQSDFEVVFAGSSVVHDMIVPAEFDRVMKEAGYHVRSFNIGRAGGFAHETNYVLRRLLGPFRPRPAFIFVDFMAFEPQLNEPDSARVRNWHDLPETLSALLTVVSSSIHDRDEKLEFARQHLRLALERFFPLGRFYEEGRADPKDLQLIENLQGYMPFEILSQRDPVIRSMNEYFLKEPTDYQDLLRRRLDEVQGLSGQPMRTLNKVATAWQLELLNRRDVLSLYVAAPSLRYDLREIRALAKDLSIPHVLFYDDPRESPDLFDPEARFDRHHLNDASSLLYTRAIALDFLSLAESESDIAERLDRFKAR